MIQTNEQSAKKVKHEFERSTCFTDKRLFSCISEYHQKIDLTKCSCREFNYYMILFQTKRIHPRTIIVSNVQLIKQIEIFLERIIPSITYHLDSIYHLSLLECPIDKLFSINSNH